MKKLLNGTRDSIVKVDTQWDFAYDGDGSCVKQAVSTYDLDADQIGEHYSFQTPIERRIAIIDKPCNIIK